MKTELDKFKVLEEYKEEEKLLLREIIKDFDYGSYHHFHNNFINKISESSNKFIEAIQSVIVTALAIKNAENNPTLFNNLVNVSPIVHKSEMTKMTNLFNKNNYILAVELIVNEWFSHAEKLNIDITDEKKNLLLFKDMTTPFVKIKEAVAFIELAEQQKNYLKDISMYPTTKEFLKRRESLKQLVTNENLNNKLLGHTLDSFPSVDNPNYIMDFFNLDTIKEFVDSKIINSILLKIKEVSPDYLNTDSEDYIVNTTATNELKTFLNDKNFEDKINFKINMTKGQTYQEIIVFNDSSILAKNNKDEYKTLLSNEINIKKEINQIYTDYIAYKLRKKPKAAEFFKTMLVDDDFNIKGSLITINTFLDNETILKNENFKLSEYYRRSLESIDDAMNKHIEDFKLKQYAHSITSSKYKHLYDKESYVLFKSIKDTGVKSDTLQSMIGKKIAAYHTPEDFNKALNSFLNSINGFSPEAIQLKAEGAKIDIDFRVNDNSDLIILKIDNYNQSKLLGSQSWCIVRNDHYFNQYTANNAQQFFIYDFSKDSKENLSMIGMTLTSSGNYYTAHIKNDNSLPFNDFLKNIQYTIINQNPEIFINLDPELKNKVDLHFSPPIVQEIEDNQKLIIKPKMSL